MWNILAQVANTGMNMWMRNEQAKATEKNYIRQLEQTKFLAAQQLSITYNSISQRSLEVATQFRRKEFTLRSEQRAAEGQVAAQAAQAGATGRRASLAQKQATAIPAERELAGMSADSKREQDALIRQADMEERAMVNRLINAQPDVPSGMEYDMIPDLITGGAAIGTSLMAYAAEKRAKEMAKDEAIVGGSSENTAEQLQI